MNSNRVIGRAVRYSTVKGDEIVSYKSPEIDMESERYLNNADCDGTTSSL